MNPNESFRKLKSELDAEREKRLDKAKTEATEVGKEPFDLDVMDRLWRDNPDARSESLGCIIPREDRIAEWSEIYYVQYPQIHTMSEFVEQMKVSQIHGFFD